MLSAARRPSDDAVLAAPGKRVGVAGGVVRPDAKATSWQSWIVRIIGLSGGALGSEVWVSCVDSGPLPEVDTHLYYPEIRHRERCAWLHVWVHTHQEEAHFK